MRRRSPGIARSTLLGALLAATATIGATAQEPAADLRAAEQHLRAGELGEARRDYTLYVSQRRDDPRGHAGLGRTLARMRRLHAATEAFRAALALRPDDVATTYDLASVLNGQARFEEALVQWRALDALAARTPALRERPEWMLYWAAAASKVERRPEALAVLRRLVELAPGELRYRQKLGHELLLAGEFNEAAMELARVAGRQPNVHRNHYLLGWAHLQTGDDAAAEAALLEARRLDSTDAEVHLKLGKLYHRQRRHDEAWTSYRKAVEQNPLAHEGWHALSRLARIRGEPEEAERCTERFESIRAQVDARVERLRVCNRRVANDPDDLEAYREAARIYLEEGKFDEAEEWLTRLLGRAPTDDFAILNLSTLLARRGEMGAALHEVEKLLERDPLHGEANLQAARIHGSRRRWEDTRRHLEIALPHLTEQRAEAHLMMATALEALGQREEAARHRAAAQAHGR